MRWFVLYLASTIRFDVGGHSFRRLATDRLAQSRGSTPAESRLLLLCLKLLRGLELRITELPKHH